MGCPFGFGEINIPSSRAFWDDCDDDDPAEQNTPEKLKLVYEVGQINKAVAAELLFVIEGVDIVEFVEQTLLKEAVKICAIPSKNSSLYSIKSKNILLAILQEDLINSGEATELLLPYAEQAKRVITLTIKPKVDYKSENIGLVRDEITFIRGINSRLKHIKELQAPNFIVGVAAGVASWLENKKIPISSYVAYTDKMPLDTLAAQPILKLFLDLGVDCASTYKPKLKDNSHLYI